MKYFRLSAFVILSVSFFFFISCKPQAEDQKAKYVFLFIGDGMGVSQVIAAEAFQTAMSGGEYIPLGFRQFPAAGLSTTFAENQFITGSAAAGTALATGNKTAIGRISMDTSGTVPFETIAEKA
ncbi:MAG: alkaline phosphatase, partial [Bacteroidales bacterium]|nr:alkaline phosphatase [Bacteroidales bacterium]